MLTSSYQINCCTADSRMLLLMLLGGRQASYLREKRPLPLLEKCQSGSRPVSFPRQVAQKRHDV